MQNETWYTLTAEGNVPRLDLYGDVGMFGISAEYLRWELEALGDVSDINVRLNTLGGSVVEGLSVYALLKEHPANIQINISGHAASMGSLIAMAGNYRTMTPTSIWMTHQPEGSAQGKASDLELGKQILLRHRQAMVAAYTSCPTLKLTPEEVEAQIEHETWLTAPMALEVGWIDEIVQVDDDAELMLRAVAHADVSTFKNAPESLISNVAQLQASIKPKPGASAAPEHRKESMAPQQKTLTEAEHLAEVKKLVAQAVEKVHDRYATVLDGSITAAALVLIKSDMPLESMQVVMQGQSPIVSTLKGMDDDDGGEEGEGGTGSEARQLIEGLEKKGLSCADIAESTDSEAATIGDLKRGDLAEAPEGLIDALKSLDDTTAHATGSSDLADVLRASGIKFDPNVGNPGHDPLSSGGGGSAGNQPTSRAAELSAKYGPRSRTALNRGA